MVEEDGVTRKLLALAFAAGAWAVPAHAEAQGDVYVRGEVGVTVAGRAKFDVRADPDLDGGWMIAGAVGYDFNGVPGGPRVEGELSWREGDLAGGGTANAVTGMANAYYDVGPVGPVSPYLGAGLGYTRMKHDFQIARGHAGAFAWQAMAGVGIPLTTDLTLDLGVRYFSARADFEDDLNLPVGNIQPITEWRGGYRQVAITASLRW